MRSGFSLNIKEMTRMWQGCGSGEVSTVGGKVENEALVKEVLR